MAADPEFSDPFAVQRDNYGDFIRTVRKHVTRYCIVDRTPPVILPVLPPEQKTPRFWFHLALHTGTSTITLAIRMDNLYLVGFKTAAEVWWEFGKEGDTHLISNARWLGFGGRYDDIVGEKGLEVVMLGRVSMTAAVDLLANHGATADMPGQEAQLCDPYAQPKSMLAKLVIMVCEGIQFHTVCQRVDNGFDHETKITELEGKQVKKWDRISKAVLAWAKKPEEEFTDLEMLGVTDINDAARIVAVVKDETTRQLASSIYAD